MSTWLLNDLNLTFLSFVEKIVFFVTVKNIFIRFSADTVGSQVVGKGMSSNQDRFIIGFNRGPNQIWYQSNIMRKLWVSLSPFLCLFVSLCLCVHFSKLSFLFWIWTFIFSFLPSVFLYSYFSLYCVFWSCRIWPSVGTIQYTICLY